MQRLIDCFGLHRVKWLDLKEKLTSEMMVMRKILIKTPSRVKSEDTEPVLV